MFGGVFTSSQGQELAYILHGFLTSSTAHTAIVNVVVITEVQLFYEVTVDAFFVDTWRRRGCKKEEKEKPLYMYPDMRKRKGKAIIPGHEKKGGKSHYTRI